MAAAAREVRVALREDGLRGHEAAEAVDAAVDEYREFAHLVLDHAKALHDLSSGSTLRRLDGEEPLGYSTPDGGAKHDAYYGAKSANAQMARHLSWPLRLSEWDKQTADGDPRFGTEEPVRATGTRLYERHIGGRDVYVVVDDRDFSPI